MFNRETSPFLYRLSIYGIGFLIGLILALRYCSARNDEFTKRVKGQNFPEIKGVNLNGDSISLNKYKGNFVLVDFWASWCTPCRAHNVGLVDMAQRFKNISFKDSARLVMFSVSIDENRDDWKSAIKKDSLFWSSHVWNDKLETGFYGVKNIPTTYLLHPDGKILAKTTNLKAISHELNSFK